jgi:hypothetical protein
MHYILLRMFNFLTVYNAYPKLMSHCTVHKIWNWLLGTLQLAGHDLILEHLVYFLTPQIQSYNLWVYEILRNSRPFSTCCLQVHYMSRESG